MAITDGASAFSAAPASATSAFDCAFCSRWKPRLHCRCDESTSRYPCEAVGTSDLKIVVLISGFSIPNTHSSGNYSKNPVKGPVAHTVL